MLYKKRKRKDSAETNDEKREFFRGLRSHWIGNVARVGYSANQRDDTCVNRNAEGGGTNVV